jgi:lipoprotein-anchoring transpeptidase ErfK/SrfK
VFQTLPTDEHIVFDETLFIPPMGTKNRRVAGALGKYRLDLGDGYLLHGTPYDKSIGRAVTHGCIRLRDADIEWLYRHVPVGTEVQIY